MMQFFRKNVKAIMIVVVVLFVISCFAMYGDITPRDRGVSEAGPAGEGERDRVVARVNGSDILLSRIEMELANQMRMMGMTAAISDEQRPAFRSYVLDQIAVASEIEKEITARGITVSKEELDAAVKQFEDSFPTREIFLQQLSRAGVDEKQVRADFENRIRHDKLISQIVAPASVDESEVRSTYDTVKEFAFRRPEAIIMNLAHFRNKESATAAKSALDGGIAWDEALDAVSADVFSATPYADTVPYPTEAMQGTMEFLRSAKIGSPTEPVMVASEDYMIALAREKQEAGITPFDTVSADLKGQMLYEKQEALFSHFTQEMRTRAKVEIVDASVFPKQEPVVPASADEGIDKIISADETMDAKSADAEHKDEKVAESSADEKPAGDNAAEEKPAGENPDGEDGKVNNPDPAASDDSK